jgi:ribonuclease HII
MTTHYIIGIDEAGRGPWAGPVVAGGFMCPIDFDFRVFSPYLDDSKKMTEPEREEVFGRIEKVMESNICRYHFAYREAHDIDTL